MKTVFTFLLMLVSLCYGQFEEIQEIDLGDGPTNYERSYVFQNDDTLYYFYRPPTVAYINVEESYDNGITWSHKQKIEGFTFPENDPRGYDIVQFTENIFYIANLTFYGNLEFYRYSLRENQLEIIGNLLEVGSATLKVELTVIDESTFIVSFCDDDDNIFLNYTSDAAETWSSKKHFSTIDKNDLPLEITYHNNYFYTVYPEENSIEVIIGENLGANWSGSSTIFTNENPITNPEIHSDGSNLYVIFEESVYDPVAEELQTDICYLVSSDNGLTWSSKQHYTKFIEKDYFSEVNLSMGELIITTLSNRSKVDKINTNFGILNYTTDPAPPVIYWRKHPGSVEYDEGFDVQVFVNDESGFSSVTAEFNDKVYTMYDDGNHNDSLAGDYIFGTSVDGYPGNVSFDPRDSYYIGINNFKLPIDRKGVLADVNIQAGNNLPVLIIDNDKNEKSSSSFVSLGEGGSLGKYDGEGVLFSGGFYLSGFTNDELWANGVSSSSLVEDYQPGPVGSDPNDSKNLVYAVYSGDQAFGQSWQNWQNAVSNGAKFYDGDGDGLYNPIDKNNNGVWDTDEDKPDLLYDASIYTVYNDGVPSSERRFNEIEPLGIEIRQSIYGSYRNNILADVLFIRYSLLYKGLGNPNEPDSIDNMIFSVWNDADIGSGTGYTDDLTGCDTTLSAGYTYNDGEDDDWGVNPPTIFKVIVQGPRVKTDNSSSTAYNKLGPDLGVEVFNGYKNLGMTTFAPPHKNDPRLPDPNTPLQVRRYQEALYFHDGSEVDPCDFYFGEVFGDIDCSDVNNKFWYSGDPVTQYGWLQTKKIDMRDLTNTGPFVLRKNEPMDIIVAYVVRRGYDAYNSITLARETSKYVHEEYERNFSTIVGVNNNPEEIVNNFSLSQNYPNPFNPTTTIKFTLPNLPSPYQGEGSRVRLVVYDILGRKVKTLVNEVKSPGSYEAQFDASQLASGVYFYRLTAADFVQTKKMILLR